MRLVYLAVLVAACQPTRSDRTVTEPRPSGSGVRHVANPEPSPAPASPPPPTAERCTAAAADIDSGPPEPVARGFRSLGTLVVTERSPARMGELVLRYLPTWETEASTGGYAVIRGEVAGAPRDTGAVQLGMAPDVVRADWRGEPGAIGMAGSYRWRVIGGAPSEWSVAVAQAPCAGRAVLPPLRAGETREVWLSSWGASNVELGHDEAPDFRAYFTLYRAEGAWNVNLLAVDLQRENSARGPRAIGPAASPAARRWRAGRYDVELVRVELASGTRFTGARSGDVLSSTQPFPGVHLRLRIERRR